MTAEEKVIVKIRKAFMDDSTIAATVGKNIYASHVATVSKPVYPSISIHMLNSNADFNMRTYVRLSVQIDVWLPFDQYNMTTVFAMLERIREILDRQNLTDTTIPIKVAEVFEQSAGPVLYEDDPKLLHYPCIYNLVAS